ncbi:MAG: hypothetical protein GY765_03030 [bacterium]|nr:hypothetical protein [bacterium]
MIDKTFLLPHNISILKIVQVKMPDMTVVGDIERQPMPLVTWCSVPGEVNHLYR